MGRTRAFSTVFPVKNGHEIYVSRQTHRRFAVSTRLSWTMHDESAPETDPELLPILDELAPQEPIFHRTEFASTLADFDRLMVADFWEFGASGRRYGREFILQKL